MSLEDMREKTLVALKTQYREFLDSNRAASEMHADMMKRAEAMLQGVGEGIAALEKDGLKLKWHDEPLKDSEK